MDKTKCVKCEKVLFHGNWVGHIDVKCPRCKYINTFYKVKSFTLQVSPYWKEDKWYFKITK